MRRITLDPLTADELDSLSLADLVARMDKVLDVNRLERYGTPILRPFDDRPTVTAFVASKTVGQKSLEEQRYLAYLFFSFLVQMELCEVSSGIANKVLFDNNYHETESWNSPAFNLRHGVIRQYDILASRVAMDIFMDLLYALDTGKRLDAKKSKFKVFRKWLKDINNPYIYFAHVLISAYRFDRQHRTPEAHGSSKFPRRFLLLQQAGFKELNESLQLNNVLLSVWHPLITILNGSKPNFGLVIEGLSDWLPVYISGKSEEIEKMLADIFFEMEH